MNDLFGGGLTGIGALDAGFGFLLALALGAPLAVVVVYEVRRRSPLIAPPLVLAAAGVTAAVITVATGWFGEPAAVAVIAPVLSAIVIVRIPEARADLGRMLGLLLLGWIGGAVALGLVDRARSPSSAAPVCARTASGSPRSISGTPPSAAAACWSIPTTRPPWWSGAATRTA